MKCLTISQPFATAIASGDKWVENRTWGPTDYRGPLLIHAGKGTQYMDRQQLREHAEEYPTGSILAVANLVACINIVRARRWDRRTELAKGITVDDVLKHKHTEGPWCWVLQDVRRFAQPIPYEGKQGLFEVPDEVVQAQL